MKRKSLLSIFCTFLFINFLSAQTWDGSASTDWNTAANWSTNAVPTATGNVIIPAGLTTYPVLASNVTINSMDMRAGSKLDFKSFSLSLLTTNQFNYFTGAALNNSDGGSDIVLNINTGGSGYHVYFRSMTVNDNITINLSGTNNFYGADNAGTANTYNGTSTFNVSSALGLYLSNGAASQYNGDLTISRSAAGNTQLFNGGGNITGNFSYTNNIDGSSLLGNLAQKTSISGTVAISLNHATPAAFQLYHFINQTAGGSINVQNSLGMDVQNDTLKVTSLSVTGYQGAAFGYFYNNKITGNITIGDDASHGNGYNNYIRGNDITGNAIFNNNGTNSMYDADNAGSGNHYTGNVSFTCAGTGALYISQGDTSKYDGNLTINRTATGITQAFNSGGVIGGNFSFTNNTAGNALFGNLSIKTSVGGIVNISVNDTTPGSFQLYRMINQTAGGTINVQNSLGMDVQNDTLKVTSLSVAGYRGAAFGYFYNNKITGNITIGDDASHGNGYNNYIRGNDITGNATFYNNGTNSMYDADNAGTGNHYTGNVSFICASTGALYISQGDTSKYDGNLTINRTAAGLTQAFNSGGVIGGNFSFTNNTAGNALFGNLSQRTSVGGTVNISVNDVTPGNFQLYRMINQTAGGAINVQNSLGMDVQNDTLVVTSLNVTGYRGAYFGYFYNNKITGNTTIGDDASHGNGYNNYIRGNDITGNATFTNNGSNTMYDADNTGSRNKYSGNVSYIKTGGPINVGTGDTTEIGGNLTLNSSSGVTLGKIKFTGNAIGIVDQLGTQDIIISQLTMQKTNAGKITLNKPLTISTEVAFNSGNIIGSLTNSLNFPDNATHTGASDVSHVNGTVIKTGNDAFTFPVGSTNFNPVSITAPGAATDVFSAQYFGSNPDADGFDTSKRAAALKRISGCEYWDVQRRNGSSNETLTFTFGNPCAGTAFYITDPSKVRIARWTGSAWEDLGNGGSTGTTTGTVSTASPVSNFSPFTFASTDVVANPLPLQLVAFAAIKQQLGVVLSWATENEKNFSHFEVEKSEGDNNFKPIGTVSALNNPDFNQYTFLDEAPLKGLNYYRLKLVDIDGNFKYSIIEPVLYSGAALITIYPNPAKDKIKILSAKKIISIDITDASGRLVKRLTVNAENRYNINDLQRGIHFIKIRDEENVTVSKKLLIE